METTYGERLTVAMLVAGATNKSHARAQRVSEQTVRDWKRLKIATLSGLHSTRSAILLNVSVIWLVTGNGDMLPNVDNMRKARLSEKVG